MIFVWFLELGLLVKEYEHFKTLDKSWCLLSRKTPHLYTLKCAMQFSKTCRHVTLLLKFKYMINLNYFPNSPTIETSMKAKTCLYTFLFPLMCFAYVTQVRISFNLLVAAIWMEAGWKSREDKESLWLFSNSCNSGPVTVWKMLRNGKLM